jgi:hypothetical protein
MEPERLPSPASVWGKTFVATGGTLLFLISLLAWGGSGARTLQENEFAASLNFVTFLPVALTLVPWIKDRVRGVMILAALVVEVGYIYLVGTGPPTVFVPFADIILLPLASLVLLGGVLVLLSRE